MAFDPGFVDYRAEANGGFTFVKPDGRELFFHGPEAERIASDIERSRPADRRTASYDPSAPFGTVASVPPSVPDVPVGGMSAPEPAMSAAPPAPPQPQAEPPMAQSAPTDGPSGGPLPGGAAAPQYVSSTGYPTGPNGDPLFPQPTEISAYKRVAPRAGGYMPAGRTETREGAKQFSRELVEGYADQAIAEKEAAMSRYDAQQAVSQAQYHAAQAAIPELQQQEAVARAKQAQIQTAVDQQRATLDRLSQEAADTKIGAPSVFGDGSAKDVYGGVMTLLSAALTSFGSAILGRGPTGFDVINARLDQHTAAMRGEMQRKGAMANNALAQYQRQFGDLQTAEAALKVVQIQKAQQMAQQAAALQGAQASREQLDSFMLASNAALLKKQQEFEDLAQGKATESISARYQAPSAGGLARKTPEELKREVEAARAVGEYNRDAQTGFAKGLDGTAGVRKQKDERELMVNLPGGKVAFAASAKRAEAAQAKISAGEEFKRNVERQREILNMAGDSVSPTLRGEYAALVQRNKLLAKESEDLGAITEADQQLVSPITGDGGQDFLAFKNKTMGALSSAVQHVNFRIGQAANELFVAPPTGADSPRFNYNSRDSAGVKVTGSINNPSAAPADDHEDD